MTRILFLNIGNAASAQLAEAFARARSVPGLDIVAASPAPSLPRTEVNAVLAEVGISLEAQEAKLLSEVATLDFDIVIVFGDPSELPALLPGHPECIHWQIDDPGLTTDDDPLQAFRACRDRVRGLVDDLLDQGYLNALVAAHQHEQLILNSISDGIIAHDLNRRIIHFNRAAEIITGYRREDVLYRDCHEALSGGFCGGRCRFSDGKKGVREPVSAELDVCRKDGERRRIRQSSVPLHDSNGTVIGILSSFSDITREQQLARRVGEITQFSGIIGNDEKMLEIFDLIQDLADTSMPVLIQGESGTGKELVAAAIHSEGPRANKQFVPVNCGALPESLLESELFGHVKGAFTGAFRDKKGRFELADGGTIFLDEIGDISPAMQVRLLRVLQEGTFERVGGETTMSVDVRVISATNKDLAEEIEDGRFREDLFYRLSVVPFWLPALRDRRTDIPLLVEHILQATLESVGKSGITISPDALDMMMNHDWPGNVRELQNWIQFALVRCRGTIVEPEHLPPHHLPRHAQSRPARRGKLSAPRVTAALRETNGNKLEAAKRLGVSRATLYRFLDAEAEA
jgi:PAS domain S-box-containing protein